MPTDDSSPAAYSAEKLNGAVSTLLKLCSRRKLKMNVSKSKGRLNGEKLEEAKWFKSHFGG